jgi:hypothetical protein
MDKKEGSPPQSIKVALRTPSALIHISLISVQFNQENLERTGIVLVLSAHRERQGPITCVGRGWDHLVSEIG